jgi:hypothetical protein
MDVEAAQGVDAADGDQTDHGPEGGDDKQGTDHVRSPLMEAARAGTGIGLPA